MVLRRLFVAVKTSTKEIPKTALVWSLTHVVQPVDCITLLVVVPSQSSGRKWGFPRFAGDCASGIKKYPPGTILEQKSDITDSGSQMILKLHDIYDPIKINVRIKIVSGSPCGLVAAEAKKGQPSWVVLDNVLNYFGKPPRGFSYAMLELDTGGFSQANFLAEGGYGSVHRGVLTEGHVIDVKQHKLASSQGDVEFCLEVEVLNCAQDRNVVMLIGFCIEDQRRLLVFEYICNGSLDLHLYVCVCWLGPAVAKP